MGSHPFQTSFVAGEITEQLAARVDIQKYPHGARCLQNFVVQPHGGAAKRAGLIFAGKVKDSAQVTILRRFEASAAEAYVMEIGVGYIRFWRNRAPVMNGSIPVEVVTPFEADDLRQLRFEQSNDVLYIANRNYEPRKLLRVSPTDFQLNVINFIPPPTFEQPVTTSFSITLASTTGSSVVVTASGNVWLAGDVGRQIISGAGRASIKTFTSATEVVVEIIDAFASTGPIPAANWSMDGSPNNGTLTPAASEPVGLVASFAASIPTFRTTDVGKFIYGNEGCAKITSFTNDTTVNGEILLPFIDTTPMTSGAWTLESTSWSPELGFPDAVSLDAGRLWWAGLRNRLPIVWGSVIQDYENHTRGPADDDAVEFPLGIGGMNETIWMKSITGLIVGTTASEIALRRDDGKPLAANAPPILKGTRHGSDTLPDAVIVENVVLFLQRGKQRVLEFGLNPNVPVDSWITIDLTRLSEHLMRVGILDMAIMTSPETILFAVRTDGVLLSLMYAKEENVIAWSHHVTKGRFESVAVIPNNCGTGDEVWVTVARDLPYGAWFHEGWFAEGWFATNWFAPGGISVHRMVEIFDGGLDVDSGLIYVGPAAGTFSGITHLDNETVKVVTAERDVFDLVVVNGKFTLPNGVTTTSLQAGLFYGGTIQTLRPEWPVNAGTAQARQKHWNTVTPRVACTEGVLLLNGEPLLYPEGTNLKQVYSGDMLAKLNMGWDREGYLVIQTTEPKPCTILGITGSIQIGDP